MIYCNIYTFLFSTWESIAISKATKRKQGKTMTDNDITDAMKALEWLLKSPDGQVLYGNAVDSDGFLYPDVKESLSNAYKILDTYLQSTRD